MDSSSIYLVYGICFNPLVVGCCVKYVRRTLFSTCATEDGSLADLSVLCSSVLYQRGPGCYRNSVSECCDWCGARDHPLLLAERSAEWTLLLKPPSLSPLRPWSRCTSLCPADLFFPSWLNFLA